MLLPHQPPFFFACLLLAALLGAMLGGRRSATIPCRMIIPFSFTCAGLTILLQTYFGVTTPIFPGTVILEAFLPAFGFWMGIALALALGICFCLELFVIRQKHPRAKASAILCYGSAAMANAMAAWLPIYLQSLLDRSWE
jgi:hypothetical protein